MPVRLNFGLDGTARAVFDDSVKPFLSIGHSWLGRGSHVEPITEGPRTGCWYADMSPSGYLCCFGPFEHKEDALTAEREWLEKHWVQGRTFQPACLAEGLVPPMLTDDTIETRQQQVKAINTAGLSTREQFEQRYGQVWDSDQFSRDFQTHSFLAPYVVVTRREDNVKGTLQFCHSPRFYFSFEPDAA